MNDDKRLKEAFRKIKQDMFVLSKQIDEIKGSKVSTKTEIKTDFDKKKFENFVNNVEKELGDLNLYLKEFDDRIKHISKKIEISDKEREDIKNKSLLNQSSSQSNKSDIELFDERFGEFSEILNEKVTLEISSLRLEFTEEVANLYDKFFNEILDLKHEITKKQKKEEKSSKKAEKETEIKKETIKEIPAPVEKETTLFNKKKTTKKDEPFKKIEEDELYPAPIEKESKMKKIAKWLFVDEEEDEIENIKSEIKKSEK